MWNYNNEKRRRKKKEENSYTETVLYYNYVDTKSVEPMKCKGKDINV